MVLQFAQKTCGSAADFLEDSVNTLTAVKFSLQKTMDFIGNPKTHVFYHAAMFPYGEKLHNFYITIKSNGQCRNCKNVLKWHLSTHMLI